MDVICKPCQDTAESPLTGKFCSRALLADYTELFLPSEFPLNIKCNALC